MCFRYSCNNRFSVACLGYFALKSWAPQHTYTNTRPTIGVSIFCSLRRSAWSEQSGCLAMNMEAWQTPDNALGQRLTTVCMQLTYKQRALRAHVARHGRSSSMRPTRSALTLRLSVRKVLQEADFIAGPQQKVMSRPLSRAAKSRQQ